MQMTFYEVQHSPSFVRSSKAIRISSSVHNSPLRKGLDDDRDGVLLIDDDFYLHLTEGPIYETNLGLAQLMTSARVAGFLER